MLPLKVETLTVNIAIMNLLAFKTYLVGIFVAAGYGKQDYRYQVVDTVSFEGLKEADLGYLEKKYELVFNYINCDMCGKFKSNLQPGAF